MLVAPGIRYACGNNIVGQLAVGVLDSDNCRALSVGEDIAAHSGVVAELVVEALTVDAVLPVRS